MVENEVLFVKVVSSFCELIINITQMSERNNPDIKELSIVLIGKFNPSIIHPQWLVRKDLIRSGEAEDAKIKVNHPEISDFDLSSCTIQVTHDRFMISSTQETYFKSMMELIKNILELLPECPVLQAGINLHHHYKFDDKEQYIKFGHIIVPKDDLWNKIVKNPGLTKVTIESEREDGKDGKIVTMVGVSRRIQKQGVEIQVNDHFDLYKKGEEDLIDASRALKLLSDKNIISITNPEKIINHIYEYGSNTKN